MNYRRLPIVVSVIQWDGVWSTIEPFLPFGEETQWIRTENAFSMDGFAIWVEPDGCLFIRTPEGQSKSSIGDYIIKGVLGDVYSCKASAFIELYEEE